MQTPSFQKRTQEIYTLLERSQMLIQWENYCNH